MASRRNELERERALVADRIDRRRRQLEADERRLLEIDLALSTDSQLPPRRPPFPNRGTKRRRVLEVMAQDSERTWTIDDLLPVLRLADTAGRLQRQRVSKMLSVLVSEGWLNRVSSGIYSLDPAARKRLS